MAFCMPRAVAEVSPQWLTDVLRHQHVLSPGHAVTALRVEDIGGGFGQTSDTCRLLLETDGTESAPRSLVAKFATSDEHRRAAALRGHLYDTEVRFYRDLAPKIRTRTPRCYAAEVDESGAEFTLLIEDFPEHRPGDETVGCTLKQAQLAVVQMGRLHGPYWGRADLPDVPTPAQLPLDLLGEAWDVMVATFGDCMPDGTPSLKQTYLASAESLRTWLLSGPQTLVHGDFRLDNLLFGPPGDDELVVLDWQGVSRSRGIRDFAYLISHSMNREDRNAFENELLHLYVDTLGESGVDYPLPQAWQDYRIAMLYLVHFVVWICGVHINHHPRAMSRKRALVARAFGALLDVGAVDLLPFTRPTD